MPTSEPDDEVRRFWSSARDGARLGVVPVYFPDTMLQLVPPPTWSFGATGQQADELLALVLEGRKTATASAAAEYEAEGAPLPEVGTLGIVLDGSGHPRALLETTRVDVVPFREVDADHARLEGEGDLSLQGWRTAHREFFGASGDFSEDMPVVLERFRVLHTSGQGQPAHG
jgi:uncharacterized protein YhfF